MDTATERLPRMLRGAEPEREAACSELRELLVRAALAHLLRQRWRPEAFGADSAETVAEDFAQEAVAIVLRQLDTFRGESRFTTWAYRIVINLMTDEFRRRAWRRRPLEESLLEGGGSLDGQVPERVAERSELWRAILDAISNDLTPRQRHVLVGRIFQDKPLVVLAEELDTDKDNVYKVLHDARKRLRRVLLQRGFTERELLTTLEQA